MNYLEQLAYEWYEFMGYFVIRNTRVGYRTKGGWDGELDIVAFSQDKKKIIHIECSNDSLSWEKRNEKYTKKFDIGKKYIPEMFSKFGAESELKQIALLGSASKANYKMIGGGEIVTLHEFLDEIVSSLRESYIGTNFVVPEQFPVLRTIYYMNHYFNNVQYF